MDYSYYSGPQPQPFPFYGLPAGLPTPEHHQSAPRQDNLQDTFTSLVYSLAASAVASLTNAIMEQQNYQSFDPSFRFQNPAGQSFVPPPHSPPESFSKHSVSSNEVLNHTEPTSVDGGDDRLGDPSLGRSSSEEKEGTTPAQTKRKAQNRAAQRAFRERKERHVRDLEDKLNSLEEESNTLLADNERLRRELAKFTTENEILRATSGSASRSNNPPDSGPITTGPLRYSPTDFYSNIVPNGEPVRRHRVLVCSETGEKLLDVSTTWEYIQNHELFKHGLVDIAQVAEKLKGRAQCDGQGPAFRESQVRTAIEESAADDNDGLL
ncbi:putative bZIP transcription factor (Fcr3) [Aspergillus affinis]|uniref:putative bZIP transcription factor (Fcr3) n=1 Tax=Aspergillus affinis TaxID=1070780 RepID=UPI0022FEDC49|nr:putative bZIP transcription factor [Aspergillus affinis]KAI9041169.1 putative bZIP transcription factor [Aspergillus affinis]